LSGQIDLTILNPASPMSIVRHFLSVGSATLVSRVLGFLRDSMIAAALGTGPVADAFFVAFRLPNLFRRLFSEGAFNSAFVPLYLRRSSEEGEEAGARFAAQALIIVSSSAIIATVLAVFAAEPLVIALAPGFRADTQKFESTVRMARICLPYLAFLTIGGVFSGILAARRHYLAVALAPVMLNVLTIIVLALIFLFGLPHTWQAGALLSVAIFLSGLSQLVLLVLAALRSGALPLATRPRLTPDIRRLMALSLPGMIAGGIAQINITISTIIASLDAGAVSVLYYADRVYQLPLGVVGIAIGTVLLPELVRALQDQRPDIACQVQNRSLEFASLLTIPAAVALGVIAHPIVEVLFERGAFGPQDTARTAMAISAFALGLPAFVAIKVLSPAFFAREDTHTPMIAATVGVVANVAVSLALFRTLGEAGIALATSIAGWLNVLVLLGILARRGIWRSDLKLEQTLRRILAAAALMGGFLWVMAKAIDPYTGAENNSLIKVSALAAMVIAGLALFFALAHLFGAVDLIDLRDRFRRRKRSDVSVEVIPPSP
jgi:putative peptidoglycan lipid II flippase